MPWNNRRAAKFLTQWTIAGKLILQFKCWLLPHFKWDNATPLFLGVQHNGGTPTSQPNIRPTVSMQYIIKESYPITYQHLTTYTS